MEEIQQNTETHQTKPNRNNNTLLIVFSALAVAAVVILIIVFTGKSHYEKGDEYLSKGQHNEALAEFQQVEPGDNDYNAAQSKINYIMGLQAFNQGTKREAITYLTKVQPLDVNYQSAQVMLEKVNSTLKQTDLEALSESLASGKDSTLIAETEKSTQKPQKLVDDVTKKYVSSIENLINKFESLYMSGRNASLNSKQDYLHQMNTVYEDLSKLQYTAPEKNAMVVELKRLASVWMEKRMNFIDKLIQDGSVSETASSRPLLEESDKAYNILMNQLNKVKSFQFN